MTNPSMSALMAVMTSLGPMSPRPRIIVGVPGIEPNCWTDAPDNLSLVGEVAWSKLTAFVKKAPESAPDRAAALAMLGVPVEHYDHRNPDHRAIAMRVLMARDERDTPDDQVSRSE